MGVVPCSVAFLGGTLPRFQAALLTKACSHVVLHRILVFFAEHACMFISRTPLLTSGLCEDLGWPVRGSSGVALPRGLWPQCLTVETSSLLWSPSVPSLPSTGPFSSWTCSFSTPHGAGLPLACACLAAVLGPRSILDGPLQSALAFWTPVSTLLRILLNLGWTCVLAASALWLPPLNTRRTSCLSLGPVVSN